MSRVYWDSMLFIYWIEFRPDFFEKVDTIFQTIASRGDQLCTSMFSVGEILAGPARTQDHRAASAIEYLFDQGQIALLPITREATRIFATLRATARVAPAGALHRACAGSYGVDRFLTNDIALHGLQVPGIKAIAGLDAGFR